MTREKGGPPLLGMRVMVTRPESCCDPLAEQLRRLGAEVLVQPAIRITEPADWGPVDAALAHLDSFDWLVFSSGNGVRYLLERLRRVRGVAAGGSQEAAAEEPKQQPLSSLIPSRVKLAAIGPGTADQLARYHLRADLVPQQFQAEALAESLCRGAQGRRFLLARASRGREVLAEQLAAAGAKVEQIVVYASVDVEVPDARFAQMLAGSQIDWITVTSSAIARSLVRLFDGALSRSKLASISPLTSGVLRELGYAPAAEAREATLPALVAAIVEAS